ncbi:MAG: hypothetical protein Q8Q49_04785 [bacterium]|nr:hypothetical protein [bacterium]
MQSQSEIHGGLPSRRDVLRIGAGTVLGAAVSAPMTLLGFREWQAYYDPYIDIDLYRRGYPRVTAERKDELLSSLRSYEQSVDVLERSEEGLTARIGIHPKKPNYLLFSGSEDPDSSLNVVEAFVNCKKYIVPLVQADGFSQVGVYIGDLDSPQDIFVKRLEVNFPDVSDPVSIQVQSFSIDGDPFVLGAVRNTPEFYLRDENQADETVTNDLPTAIQMELGESFFNEWLEEFVVRFTGEDEGSSPHPLADDQGRLQDIDSLVFFKLNKLGGTAGDAYTGKAKRKHSVHAREFSTYMQFPPEFRRAYKLRTKNNMVSLADATMQSQRLVSLLSDSLQIRLGHLDHRKLDVRNFALEIIAVRESIRQGHVTLDDPYVQWFMRVMLHGEEQRIRDFIDTHEAAGR